MTECYFGPLQSVGEPISSFQPAAIPSLARPDRPPLTSPAPPNASVSIPSCEVDITSIAIITLVFHYCVHTHYYYHYLYYIITTPNLVNLEMQVRGGHQRRRALVAPLAPLHVPHPPRPRRRPAVPAPLLRLKLLRRLHRRRLRRVRRGAGGGAGGGGAAVGHPAVQVPRALPSRGGCQPAPPG